MLPLNKYLGWVKRWYNTAETGPTPDVISVLDVSRDWPHVPTTLNRDYVTIAGSVATPIYAPAIGRHGLVVFLSAGINVGFPATDRIQLIWDRNPSAPPGFQITEWNGTAAVLIGLIGVNAVNTGVAQSGVRPVYVPAGYQITVNHTSVAGGQNITCRAQVYDLPDYLPMVRL